MEASDYWTLYAARKSVFIGIGSAVLDFRSILRAIMVYGQLQWFSWWGCFFIGFMYSAFVFLNETPEDRPSIFSKQNRRSPAQILLIHSSFLVLLFLVMGTFAHIAGYLPHWLTDGYDMGEGPVSVANVLFFIGAALLAVYEKNVLFPGITESQTD